MGQLPETLKEAYDEIYQKIRAQKGSPPKIADRAFQWVMCSREPLSPALLTAAVCQDPATDASDSVDIDPSGVVDACSNLLIIDEKLNLVRFSHLSVQEYFESHHWKQSEINSLLAKVCLSLLISPLKEFSLLDHYYSKYSYKEDGIYKITKYASFHWMTHVQQHGDDNVDARLSTLLMRFLGSMNESGLAYINWHEFIKSYNRRSKLPSPLNRALNCLEPSSSSSFSLATFGFYKITLAWWKSGFHNVNQRNHQGNSLLMLASWGGHVPIVKHLLEHGADVTLKSDENTAYSNSYIGTALTSAARNGHEAVVKLLLERGATSKFLMNVVAL